MILSSRTAIRRTANASCPCSTVISPSMAVRPVRRPPMAAMPLPLAPSTKQSITGGTDRWLKIPLDLSQPPVTYAVQALDIVRKTPTITFFRPTTSRLQRDKLGANGAPARAGTSCCASTGRRVLLRQDLGEARRNRAAALTGLCWAAVRELPLGAIVGAQCYRSNIPGRRGI